MDNNDSPATAAERFRYWFDGVMSKGTVALIGLLGLATVAVITVVSLVISVFGLWTGGKKSVSDGYRRGRSVAI